MEVLYFECVIFQSKQYNKTRIISIYERLQDFNTKLPF